MGRVEPFAPRPIEFLGLRRHEGWTLEEDSITYGPGALRRADFEAGAERLRDAWVETVMVPGGSEAAWTRRVLRAP